MVKGCLKPMVGPTLVFPKRGLATLKEPYFMPHGARYPSSTLLPFSLGGSLLKQNSRKKGTLLFRVYRGT